MVSGKHSDTVHVHMRRQLRKVRVLGRILYVNILIRSDEGKEFYKEPTFHL